MRISVFVAVISVYFGIAGGLRAHQVETVEFEFQKLEKHWRLVGEMDIAYMLPETRKVKGGLPLSREGVMKAQPQELARIRRETENTLRGIIRITFSGKEIPWRVEFPDFDKKPFSLPEEAADWALLTTRVVMDAQSQAGELRVHWSGEEESELIILTEDSENGEIVSVQPGGEILLMTVEATGVTTTPEQATMSGWIESGYRHVVPVGMDHILFILGLFLMVPKWKLLLQQSLMFTLAHSITLALAVFGLLDIPQHLLQILIALSIAFIGVENLLSQKVGKLRLFMVLGFGLVHGIGYASGFADKLKGLPRSQLIGPLLSFNLGVELAQVTVLVVAFLLIWPLRKWTRNVQLYGSIFVALAGFVWMIELIFFK
ncbi:MAG: HupE/UreJ family protein [Gloeobacteraceae cyanobacterium ES-bin-144]|nr:HupE/UreJ family protein [Verrucomicrobiales bacterium]